MNRLILSAMISVALASPGLAQPGVIRPGLRAPVVSLDPAGAPAGPYTLDSRHMTLTARVRHSSLGYVSVHFDRVTGNLTWDPDVTKTKVTIDIDTKVISTNIPNGLGGGTFAQQVAGPDFFDGYTYPKATFVSTKITKTDASYGTIEGDLTLHGVTKPVVLHAELLGAGVDQLGERRIAFTATAMINRRDFGITMSTNELIGDQVSLSIDTEFCAGTNACR